MSFNRMASRSFNGCRLLTGSSKCSVCPISVSYFLASRQPRGEGTRVLFSPGKFVSSAESSTATVFNVSRQSAVVVGNGCWQLHGLRSMIGLDQQDQGYMNQHSRSHRAAIETNESVETPKEAPAKPKHASPVKAPAKALPELMEEEVIPSLKAILEAQDDLTEIELSFQDNNLEGSFLKNGIPYSFWAFFPNGIITGSEGFSVSSYGSGASTVEPFIIDDKRITAKHVLFWVEKRLAAQGILPVWTK